MSISRLGFYNEAKEMITESQRETLSDVFENIEALDKITVEVDASSRTVLIRYEDLDDEWFR